ncbi:MAG: acyloxyacyl hydrolase [Pseudomonadota bacterium]
MKTKILTRYVAAMALLYGAAVSPATAQESPSYFDILAPDEVRLAESFGDAEDVNQFALVFHSRGSRRLHASRMELALGSFSTPADERFFLSYGPVWRLPERWLPVARDRVFVDLGFAPTYVAGSNLNGRDIGGNFHFTSSLGVGAFLDKNRNIELALRVQHTSNGGLADTNPGLDMIGLSFTYRPRR